MKGKGFVVHVALTSTLDRLDADARTAVIGAAYARVRGLDDYRLPKKHAALAFLVEGIAAEAAELCDNLAPKRPVKTGAQRTAEYRARLKAAGSDESDESDVTERHNRHNCDESDECDARDESDAKEINKEIKSGTLVTPTDLKMAAHNLGVPEDYALGYFATEMEKLGWMARSGNGTMFRVTPARLASVLRGWWNVDKQKNVSRASIGEGPVTDVPSSVGEGDLIS